MVGLARAAVVGDFICRCYLGTTGEPYRLCRTAERISRSSAQLHDGKDAYQELHEEFTSEEHARLEFMLIIGSIGLAAWSQLFVSSGQGPASRLSGLTLGLLLGGSACMFAGPLLWRAEGSAMTRQGRGATLEVGFTLIGFALASAVVDLRIPVLAPVAAGLTILAAVRQMLEAYRQIGAAKNLHFESFEDLPESTASTSSPDNPATRAAPGSTTGSA